VVGVGTSDTASPQATMLSNAHGARVLTGTPVLEVSPDADGVTVRTADQSYRVRIAVLTAGPWTARLAPAYAGIVRPKRIVMTWFAAAEPDRFTPRPLPGVHPRPRRAGRVIHVCQLSRACRCRSRKRW
jgi:sarcosine oxidase